MINRLLTLIACAAAGCAEDPQPPLRDPRPVNEQLVTVTVPAPDGPNANSIQLSDAVTELLKKGWRITQTTSLGKTTDGKGYILALVLDHSPPMAFPMGPGFPRMMPGPPPMTGGGMAPEQAGQSDEHEPGRADPVTAAPQRDLQIRWDDGSMSHVVVGAPVGNRNPATVTTNGPDGQLEVTYPASAFVDDEGSLQVDGRGEPLTGPKAEGYSPDSFAIRRDGSVTTMDDNDQVQHARVVGSEAEKTPVPAPGPGGKPTSPHQHDL